MMFAHAFVVCVTRVTGSIHMGKKVALVGHCGPDSSYLRMAVKSALRDADVVMVDDDADLQRAVENGVDLLLLNRELEFGFTDRRGVDVVKRLRPTNPSLKM